MSFKKLEIALVLCFFTHSVFAQLTPNLIGSASNTSNNCFELTPAVSEQAGAVWFDNIIDLTQDFTIDFDANFGDRDTNGANGIALVFKADNTPVIGASGEEIGYGGISPSVAIEFDSADNLAMGDITADHIAVQRDGISNHNTAWANLGGPTQASNSSVNIEDGLYHNIKVEYIAATQQLFVYFDCDLRVNVAAFPIETYLGQSQVYFGFTASTGGTADYNQQQICVNNVTNVDLLQDAVICVGDSIGVDATTLSGITYNWTPTTGVSNPNIANPTITPSETTTYTVSITDDCGNTESHDMTLEVTPTSNAGANATICSGETYTLNDATSNGTSFIWISFGNGIFSNATLLNPVYTPGTLDIINGEVTLMLVSGSEFCSGVSDSMTITINPTPTIPPISHN